MSYCKVNNLSTLVSKGDQTKRNQLKVRIVLWLTLVTMVLEISVGAWSGSMALLADGWHMGSHAAAFGVALFVYFYAQKHANNQAFNFGTGKVHYLGGFASAVGLAVVALFMLVESLARLVEPENIQFDEAILVAIIGLAVNIVSAFVLHEDHHHDHDHHHHDHNIKAAYFHVLADALTSLLAIAALIVGRYLGWIWMDALMGIVGSVIIGKWSLGLMKDSSAVLLDKAPQDLSQIKSDIENNCKVTIRDFHVWTIAQNASSAVLTVSVDGDLDREKLRRQVKESVPNLVHLSIELTS